MNLDSLASQIADELIISTCADSVLRELRPYLLKSEAAEDERFKRLYSRLAPWDKRFKEAVERIWAEQRRIMLANLKKLKKGYALTKFGADQILYPIERYKKQWAKLVQGIFPDITKEAGQAAVAEIARLRPELHVAFDVTNPRVRRFIERYAYRFSENLETVNVEKLRKTLIEGINAGESIPDLIKRVNETYDNWNTNRSEMIARTETIRASNEGSLEGYRQSGVVEQKMWLVAPDERTCDICNGLGELDPIRLDDMWEADGEEIDGPPAHPRCRCAVAPYIEEREE